MPPQPRREPKDNPRYEKLVRVLLMLVVLVALETYTMRHAFANGRFPLAQQALVVPGGKGNGLVVRSTFGLLVSRDRGRSFDWVCEQTFGYSGAWDPPIAYDADGTLYLGLENGLVSTRDFCNVTRIAELEGETVKDLSVDSAGTVLVVTTTPTRPSALFRRLKGKPFERVGKGLEGAYLVTVDAAPSRPSRVYVTGQPLGTLLGRFYRSDDGGATFKELEQARSHDGAYFLVGVDPKDPARVVSRFLHFEGSEIALSEDAAKTSKTVLSMKSAMYGAAMAPDGAHVFAASGLSTDGVFVSSDRGRTFQSRAHVGAQCLTATEHALFQCENPFSLGGPAFGVSEDFGKTFHTVSSFDAVRGPIACPGSDVCKKAFADLTTTLAPWRGGLDGGADDAGRVDGGSADDGGSVDGGPVGGSDGGNAPEARKRGCGCQHAEPDGIHGGAFALGVWAFARARRRRSFSRHGR